MFWKNRFPKDLKKREKGVGCFSHRRIWNFGFDRYLMRERKLFAHEENAVFHLKNLIFKNKTGKRYRKRFFFLSARKEKSGFSYGKAAFLCSVGFFLKTGGNFIK